MNWKERREWTVEREAKLTPARDNAVNGREGMKILVQANEPEKESDAWGCLGVLGCWCLGAGELECLDCGKHVRNGS